MPVLKYHDGTAWTEVSTAGPQGPPGPAGATGPTGTAGITGPAGATPDVSQFVQKAGDTMAGALTLAADPIVPLEAATKAYVDAQTFVQAGTAVMPMDSTNTLTQIISYPEPFAAPPIVVLTNGDAIANVAYFGVSGVGVNAFKAHPIWTISSAVGNVRAYWIAVGVRP